MTSTKPPNPQRVCVLARGWPDILMVETIVPLKWIEYGAYVDLIIVHPKPYSIYLIKGGYSHKVRAPHDLQEGLPQKSPKS